MARIFLDTNFFIDLAKRNKSKQDQLRGHTLFVSPLSTHILFYAYKMKVPADAFSDLIKGFGIAPLTESVLTKGLMGPTNDLEDNLQLHSAVEIDSEIFLTSDKKLLALKFFGKMAIQENLK